MSIKSKLSALINLASSDGHFAKEERKYIDAIASVNGISKEEVDSLIKNPEKLPSLSTLDEEDRFEYLYQLVQLMKIDNEIYLSEIKYCESLAEKLGFKKEVIAKISSRVYSDPSITSDINALKKIVNKLRV